MGGARGDTEWGVSLSGGCRGVSEWGVSLSGGSRGDTEWGPGGVASEWGVLDGGVNLEEMLPGV